MLKRIVLFIYLCFYTILYVNLVTVPFSLSVLPDCFFAFPFECYTNSLCHYSVILLFFLTPFSLLLSLLSSLIPYFFPFSFPYLSFFHTLSHSYSILLTPYLTYTPTSCQLYNSLLPFYCHLYLSYFCPHSLSSIYLIFSCLFHLFSSFSLFAFLYFCLSLILSLNISLNKE